MSHDATNWAIKQRGLKPAAKILLWHLADCHNPSHGCFPSQEYLAEHAEMSERGVRRHLEELEGFGLILREKVKQSGRFDRTEYTLNLHVLHSPQAKLTTGQNVSLPPAKMGTHHRPNCPPNPVSEPVKETTLLSEVTPSASNEGIWTKGLEDLNYLGMSDRSARTTIGKWCKTFGQDQISEAISQAKNAGTPDPVPYIERMLKPSQKKTATQIANELDEEHGRIQYSTKW